jgi:tRNA(Ile)-lysidine synthase
MVLPRALDNHRVARRVAEWGNRAQHGAVETTLSIPWLQRGSRRARWLVGVSGGADSVALLHLLVGAGFKQLVVCHLDHCLRGRASVQDARFVARLAARLGLPCVCGRDDVRLRLAQGGMSLETAAREARHRFFARCAIDFRCRRLLLAHHADDQAETVLWNLCRGSYGMRGMREEQPIVMDGVPVQVVRPLLGVRRDALAAWLREHKHAWREDASNVEPVAIRNRLRHELLPLWAEITGRDPVAALVRAAADDAETRDLERALVRDAALLDPQGRIHLPVFRGLAPVLQRAALRDYLAAHGVPAIDRDLLERGLGLGDPGAAPSINLPGGRRLRRKEARLWVE